MKLRRITKFILTMRALLWVTLIGTGASAQAQSCRQALVLALDVSGSVNAVEYQRQVDGLAAALDDPDVRGLILTGIDAPVMLAVFEWSSRNHQYVIQPWIRLDSAAALDGAIARIQAHRPVRAGLKTALGTALTFAAGMLDQQSHCWRLTVDVSADGPNNIGPTAQQVYALDGFDRVTVNALVIGDASGTIVDPDRPKKEALRQYFEDQVIRGPQAFSMIAGSYREYSDTMRRKLIRELSLPIFGMLAQDP